MKMTNLLFAIALAGCAHLPSVSSADVKKLSQNSYVVEPAIFKKHVDNPISLANKVKVSTVRHKKTRKIVGYRLKKIEKGSIIDRIGFKNGDVLYEINGKKLNSLDAVWAAYNEMKEASFFNVKFTRKVKKRVKRMSSNFRIGDKTNVATKTANLLIKTKE